jgi:hypothetical protein
MSRHYRRLLAPILLATFAAPVMAPQAMAQESPPKPDAAANHEGVIDYTPADFAAARPNTALDMVNRLPGFSLESGDQVRGFAGAAGNVLIDGQRPTSKSEGLGDALARIPIAQVERIDLIRGGASGIDMQGQTVLANVIRKKVDSFQQTLQLNSFIFTKTGHTIPGWNYQATKRSGEHQFDFQIGRGISMDDSVGTGWRTTRDVSTGDVLFQNADTEGDGPNHSIRANYKGPLAGGTFSANGLIATSEFKNESHFYSDVTDERYIDRSANTRGEIGLNYTHPVTSNLEAEFIALSKLTDASDDSTGASDGSLAKFGANSEAGESIGRTVLRYKPSDKLSFEGGGEVAFNYRDQQIALAVDGTPIPLPRSDVRVEELRSEGFVQGTWRPSSKYTLEAGVRVERSTLTQSGEGAQEASFVYPKPRVLLTVSPTKNDQIRMRIEREIGQLNFEDFASSLDLNTNVQNTGNAELVPDKTWAYEIAFEKRFWGNAAAVLTLRHEDISDVIDVLPFTVFVDDDMDGVLDDLDNDGFPDPHRVSGTGNIGDGTNDVIELNLTLPLEKVGLKGAEFKIDANFQNSEVTDPTTGSKRRISGQRPNRIEAEFRQDLPAYNLTLGASWFAGWSERHYYPREVQSLALRNFWQTYAEYKPTKGFTMRAELSNLDPYRFNIERRVFDDTRDIGSLETVEHERRNSQVFVMLRGRWTFN